MRMCAPVSHHHPPHVLRFGNVFCGSRYFVLWLGATSVLSGVFILLIEVAVPLSRGGGYRSCPARDSGWCGPTGVASDTWLVATLPAPPAQLLLLDAALTLTRDSKTGRLPLPEMLARFEDDAVSEKAGLRSYTELCNLVGVVGSGATATPTATGADHSGDAGSHPAAAAAGASAMHPAPVSNTSLWMVIAGGIILSFPMNVCPDWMLGMISMWALLLLPYVVWWALPFSFQLRPFCVACVWDCWPRSVSTNTRRDGCVPKGVTSVVPVRDTSRADVVLPPPPPRIPRSPDPPILAH